MTKRLLQAILQSQERLRASCSLLLASLDLGLGDTSDLLSLVLELLAKFTRSFFGSFHNAVLLKYIV